MCGEATGLLVRGGQRPQVVLLKHGPGSCHTLSLLTSPEALTRQPAPLFAFHSVQVGCQPVLPCKLRSKSASACACCCCTIKLPPVLPRALPTVKHHSAGRKRHRWPGRPQAAARWVCSGRQAVHSGDCWAQLGAVAKPPAGRAACTPKWLHPLTSLHRLLSPAAAAFANAGGPPFLEGPSYELSADENDVVGEPGSRRHWLVGTGCLPSSNLPGGSACRSSTAEPTPLNPTAQQNPWQLIPAAGMGLTHLSEYSFAVQDPVEGLVTERGEHALNNFQGGYKERALHGSGPGDTMNQLIRSRPTGQPMVQARTPPGSAPPTSRATTRRP